MISVISRYLKLPDYITVMWTDDAVSEECRGGCKKAARGGWMFMQSAALSDVLFLTLDKERRDGFLVWQRSIENISCQGHTQIFKHAQNIKNMNNVLQLHTTALSYYIPVSYSLACALSQWCCRTPAEDRGLLWGTIQVSLYLQIYK